MLRRWMWLTLAAGCGDAPCERFEQDGAQTGWLPVESSPAVAALGGFSASDAPELGAPRFERVVVDGAACGAAYVEAADLDADGQAEILVSSFGEGGGLKLPFGALTVYRQSDGIRRWSAETVFDATSEVRFPNQPRVADVDQDGDADILQASGFFVCEIVPFHDSCGGFAWFEQDGGDWIRHDLVPPGSELFYHDAVLADLNADGYPELMTVGEQRNSELSRAEAQWFAGEPGGFATEPHTMGAGLGGLVSGADLDGDGDMDLLSSEYFAELDSYAWMEQVTAPSAEAPDGVWERHAIADDVGGTIQLRLVPDLLGDGVLRAVGSNHTNTVNKEPDPEPSEVRVYTVPADPREPWPGEPISTDIVSLEGTGVAAPGAFDVGDVDGDGDLDIAVSGDGDERLLLYEQLAPGVFGQWTLDFYNSGGVRVVDLDGDGAGEILVAVYGKNALLLYRFEGRT